MISSMVLSPLNISSIVRLTATMNLFLLVFACVTIRRIDAAASARLCEEGEVCQEAFYGMSCTDVIRTYSLTGGCCSLSDSEDGTGCILTVSSPDATMDAPISCLADQRHCPDCCMVHENGEITCVGPTMIELYSVFDVRECPASPYVTARTVAPLLPFNITAVDDGTLPSEDELSSSVKTYLEIYLEEIFLRQYPGIIVSLREPNVGDMSFRHRNRRRELQESTGTILLEYLGEALIPSLGETVVVAEAANVDGTSIVASQLAALKDTESLQSATGLVLTSIHIEGQDPIQIEGQEPADSLAASAGSTTIEDKGDPSIASAITSISSKAIAKPTSCTTICTLILTAGYMIALYYT